MDPTDILKPTVFGLALAAVAVAAGAPIFSRGLRALRLRHLLAQLRATPLTEHPNGLALTSGRVVLESPLFGPLSAERCAGFTLEITGVGSPVNASVHVRRAFQIHNGGVSARVLGARGQWSFEITREREVAASEPLTENLQSLIARIPEAAWWRRGGGALRLTERALLAGTECHVVGMSRTARPAEMPMVAELQRTGTDDAVSGTGMEVVAAGVTRPATEPDLWISAGEQLDFMRVSDRAPHEGELVVPAWHAIGVGLGPALTFAGLMYLASAADYLRAVGRF